MQGDILQLSAQIVCFLPNVYEEYIVVRFCFYFEQVLLYYSACSIEGKKLGR